MDYDIAERTTLSTVQVGDVYESRLEIRDAFYMDTGYYVCHHKADMNFDDSSAKVYVYVKGKTNAWPLIFYKVNGDLFRRKASHCHP